MFEDFVDFVLYCVVGFVGYFFGGLDGFVKVLIILSVIDYLSGLCVGYAKHNLSSSTGFKGIARKVMIFALVGISHLIDKEFLNDTATLKTAVCLFYIGNEGISILENAHKLGIPLPNVLIKHFKQFKEIEKQCNQKQ